MSRKSRKPALDAPIGRVAFGASGIWAATSDSDLAAGRLAGEREAHWPADAGDGSGGDLLQTRDEHAAAGTRDLPVFIEAQGDHGSRPGVVRGHHLYPDEARVHVSDGGDGLLHSKNEAHRQPVLNLHIARAYLTATDPEVAKRTWQVPMDEMTKTKTGPTHPAPNFKC